MEDLRGAAQAAEEEEEQRRVAYEKFMQEREARRLEDERVSSERAQQFVNIVQSKNIPPVGEYDEVRERVLVGETRVSRLTEGANRLGWIAIHGRERRDGGGDLYGWKRAVFVTQDAEIYTCTEGEFKGTAYATNLSPAPAALTGKEEWDALVGRLGELGAAE